MLQPRAGGKCICAWNVTEGESYQLLWTRTLGSQLFIQTQITYSPVSYSDVCCWNKLKWRAKWSSDHTLPSQPVGLVVKNCGARPADSISNSLLVFSIAPGRSTNAPIPHCSFAKGKTLCLPGLSPRMSTSVKSWDFPPPSTLENLSKQSPRHVLPECGKY